MKRPLAVWAGFVSILGLIFILHAQETAMPVQSATPDSIVQFTADAQGLSQVSPLDLPRGGTFWVIMPGYGGGVTALPYPCLTPALAGLPVYGVTDNAFLVDDTGGQVMAGTQRAGRMAANMTVESALESQASAVVNLINTVQGAQLRQMARSMGMSGPMPGAGGGGGDGTNGFYSDSFYYSPPTNGLFLELTNVSGGLAYLNLHNATNQVYEIWSKTNLSDASWDIEMELWPTDTNCMPFVLSLNSQPSTFFVWARDWTGVTSGGNETPEWWFWKFFDTVNLSDSGLDANGDTLLYDYTNNIAPNDVGRAPILLSTISVTDPVDLKWAGNNLYVLSGSTATITEFDANGNAIRSLSGIGTSPSGFDVDAAGNVYVAMNGDNQVWKFNPTNTTFAADATFGNAGYIGSGDGSACNYPGAFNAPFDVAASPDGGTISVSDSGNNYIQQFDSGGNYLTTFGSQGSDVGQFNAPMGLTYDSVGTLYIVDSGNNRIVLMQGTSVEETTGTTGTAFGQFNSPLNVNFGGHGVYVADTGNNRIQSFKSPASDIPFSADWSAVRFSISASLNQPSAVAARDDDLTTEKFYVADTGNNRVLLYALAPEDPTPAWTNMTARVAAGDISGAISQFASVSTNNYQHAFASIGTNNAISAISEIGALTPVYINGNQAEYFFTNTIDGQVITFPVEFVKENSVWKILEF